MSFGDATSILDYLIDHQDFDWAALFAEWTWLVPNRFTVWLMNRFGDLFIVFDDGSVHMLDVGCGTLKQVANSCEEFKVKLDEDDHANNWFMIPLVDELVAAGITLHEGQCYSYKKPPVLGGYYTLQNSCVLPIVEHYGAYGSIHNQIKDLPDGSEVVIPVVK
jgi:hypothetical protein